MIRNLQIAGAVTVLGFLLPTAWATSGPPATTGLTVDTSSRAAVVAFWNEYYGASEGAEAIMGWSGSYGGTCNPGTTSTAFAEAVERRINFYRALAGISADTVTNSGSTVVINGSDPYKPSAGTTKSAAAQRAALMFSYAGQLSHDPPPASPYSCWSSAAWNAAKNSNLGVGFCGPEAIDAYMRENDPQTLSVWSSTVGHRRWILKQGVSDFATGDVPGLSPHYQPANVLYVFPAAAELVSVAPKFVAWPSEGHFPDALMAKQWSLSHPNADFSSASVSMTDGSGSPVSVSLVDNSSLGLGDPSIVWSVPNAVAEGSVTADTTYHVTVSGIGLGGSTVSHSYSVTVIDPDVVPDSLDLTGTTSPPLSGANYFFEPVDGAENHSVVASVSETVSWTAGAEDGDGIEITDGTGAAYTLRSSSGYVRSGSKAFRLVFPSASELDDQSFTIEREVTAQAGGTLNYYLRRGYMTPGMILEVATSLDGLTWTAVDSIAGTSSGFPDDNSFKLRSVVLTEGVPMTVRFRLVHGGGGIYVASSSPRAGAFIDDISFSNCEWTVSESEVEADTGDDFVRVASTDLIPSPSEGDTVALRLKATIGGRGYTTPAPLSVTFVVGSGDFDEWKAAEFPQITGGFEDDHDADGLSNGLEYAFDLSPLEPSRIDQGLSLGGSSLQLTTPLGALRSDVLYEMEVSGDLSQWDSAGVSVQHTGGQLIGTAATAGDKGFARWKVSQP